MTHIYGENLMYSEYFSVNKGYGIYSVYGEDPNCDLGGTHTNPYLGDFEGTFEEVLEYAANNIKSFYTWGSGGFIKPSKNNVGTKIVNVSKKIQLERKEKLNKIADKNIDYLIENIQDMTINEIKNYLIEIKTSFK